MPLHQTPINLRRPGTLQEVALFEKTLGKDKRSFLIASFLDDFYRNVDPANRRQRIEAVPPLTDDDKADALMGAIAEHLCRRWALGEPPQWTEEKKRFLHQPWFLGPERFKPILLAESPSAYRRRFIFAEAEPLRRASMPRDGRWWYYEKLRTGITPENVHQIANPATPTKL